MRPLNQGGPGGRGRRRVYRPMSDINVTPFVDVMLVLLVVFMVTAPLLTVAVPLDLPKTEARSINQDKEPLVVSIDQIGTVYLQENRTELEDLVGKLKAITGTNPDARIFVRGDKSVSYGRIMEVMGTISSAGFNKVALVAELPRPDAPSAKPIAGYDPAVQPDQSMTTACAAASRFRRRCIWCVLLLSLFRPAGFHETPAAALCANSDPDRRHLPTSATPRVKEPRKKRPSRRSPNRSLSRNRK